ncbi:MAG: molybdenum cofactor guanylyltransferase [Actinobacteria bacterium]|nr:molybdenum cofactor guanylyltransferase [Actinomycetota bacterium]
MTGVVLAGGASSRFGTPKTAALLAGRPLIEYPLAAMRAAGLPALVVAKSDNDVASLIGDVELLVEPEHPRHPLRGIVSALEHADGPIVVCACDMPFVNEGVLRMLAALPDDLAVVEAGGVPQPMLGRYTPAVLDTLATALAEERSVRATLQNAGANLLPPSALAAFGDPEVLVRDVDTPEDLAIAEGLLTGDR